MSYLSHRQCLGCLRDRNHQDSAYPLLLPECSYCTNSPSRRAVTLLPIHPSLPPCTHCRSSLGCCFSTDNHDRYYEDSSYSGEPDYPPYAALMMQRTHQQARAARSSLRSSKGSAVSTSATTAAATYYDTPTVFYPRGGSSECVWRLAYHEPVQVDATTAQIGIASATW